MQSEKVTIKSVSCTGGDGESGHPKIYLEIDPKIGEVTCPYCSKVFTL